MTGRQVAGMRGEAGARLHGRRLLLVRAGWVVAALVVLGLWIPGFALILWAGPRSPLAYPPEVARVAAAFGLSGHPGAVAMSLVFLLVPMLAFTGLALLIFLRRPDDPMALFVSLALLTIGAAATRGPFTLQLVYPALRPSAVAVWATGLASLTLLLYLFPDGRFVPRWTRLLVAPAVGYYIAAMSLPGVATAVFTFSAFPASLPRWLGWSMAGVAGGLTLVGIGAQLYRYRRVSGPVERQQVKWVLLGWGGALSWFVFAFTLPNLFWSPPALWVGAVALLTMLFLVQIPVCLAIAILRYRLWDIDAIINRTLVYGALTAGVVGLYALVVVALGALLHPGDNRTVGVSLLATGLVAALFQPLRERLQRGVNRLVYGERDEPYAVLARLGRRLEGTLAPEAVPPAIVETIAGALKLPYAAIALKRDGTLGIVATSGAPVDRPVRLPLVHQHEAVGELLLAPRTPGEAFSLADRRLLDDLARQAGIAVHAVRLTADLRRSRERLVATRDEERRRLRRDLHDGLGPQLAALALKIETARNRLAHEPAADALLADLAARTQVAVGDIRRIARALRPPVPGGPDPGEGAAHHEHIGHTARDGSSDTAVITPEPVPSPPVLASPRIRWGGLAALLGGVLCVGWSVAMASRPPGAGWGGPHRQTDDLGPFIALSLLLISAGPVGLYVQHAGRAGRLGRIGLVLGLGGAGLLAGSWPVALLSGGSEVAYTFFTFPGFLALIVGSLLSGIAVLRARVLPRWAGVLLIVAALSFMTFNTEDWRALLAVPLGVVWVVLGYRLWNIDVIINRALVYGALTASTIGIYVLAVGGLGVLFRTRGNFAISLAATLFVAILFAPLRERLQRAVNRLVYGERDDPYAVLSRLGQRLGGTLAPDAVLPMIVQTVREALRLPYAAIALAQEDGPVVAAASGAPVGNPLRLPLVSQRETVGELLLAPRTPGEGFGPADRRLLDDLARQAGVAARAMRLHADLRRSRERLVTAREEERRRLRQDLHDGLGPRLAALALKIETARNRLAHEPAADALLADLAARTQTAIADIRRLVYDLRPPALDEFGLVSALRDGAVHYEHAGHDGRGLRVTVEAPERLPPLPAAVEVAAYRIAQEALTNVVRHARACVCTVRLAHDDAAGALCLEVADDGRGLGTASGTGVGLSSMRERAEELGGTCTVESAPGGGTRVRASLPCSLPEAEGPAERELAAARHGEV